MTQFAIPSQPGNERQAAIRVRKSVENLDISEARLDRLQTAVAESALNAMEHGNQYQEDLPVEIQVSTTIDRLYVRIKDHGVGTSIPENTQPDITAKLAGEQSTRGWGLFLIKNMVDEMHMTQDETHHTIELVLNLK